MNWLWCICLVIVGGLRCSGQVCNPQQYETCTNRFIERDFTFVEDMIKSYPKMRRMHLDATEIAQFCSGFQELVECYITEYTNCDAPELEKEKIIRAAVNVLKLLCNSSDRSLIQLSLQNAPCYLEADAKCRSHNVTMFTWKEILRFERLLDRQGTCNALISHGACLLTNYSPQQCANWRGRSALDTTIRAWGGTYCSNTSTSSNVLNVVLSAFMLCTLYFMS